MPATKQARLRRTNKVITIRNAKDVSNHVRIHDEPQEHLLGLYLDDHHRLIHEQLLAVGDIDAVAVHPREVFRPAVERSAAGVILVHNHPSGAVVASPHDVSVTAQLVQAGKVLGISLLDHVIVGDGKHASVPVNYGD